jgi:hypothetical protein
VGALAAFYAGDAGSWLCRRRLKGEIAEDMVFALREAGDSEEFRS